MDEEKDIAIAARYVGGDRYWPNVPARDLTEDEWAALGEELQQTLIEQDLYALD